MPHRMAIRYAHPADAPELARTAEAMFRSAFADQNDPAQMDRYCGQHFSPAMQEDEISDPAAITLLADDGQGLRGFAQMLQGSRPGVAIDVGKSPIELQRFYVDASYHGRGLAQRLMERCIHEAATHGADAVWLGVWKSNARAIAFYQKASFEIVGEHTFMLGTEEQSDHIMVRRIA